MTKTEQIKWAEQQNIARSLMDELQTAECDENDTEVARLTDALEAMGYMVEETSMGLMVSR